ncbi:MAG: hypothetical protein JWM71_1310, partial [Solirubrobacteraceae bacterium]|nr:hypothetical protein [Solirubrobacteraceae bacterium]
MTRLAPLPLLLALVLAAPAPAASIRQLPGRSACVEMRGDLGCAKGNGTQGANAVVVAPGGRQVYAVSGFEDYGGLLTFARNPRTGALKQLPGRHGCVSNDGRNAQAGLDTKHGVGVKGHCAKARGLADAADLVISPDGRTIYTVGSASFRRDGDSIAVFRRDPATGWVREVQCWTRLKSRGCHATPVSEPRTLALTPDGRELLVGGTGLTTFRVGASGRLSTPRCTLLDGALEGDCPASAPRDNRILAVDAMAPSPDGATIYAVTGDFFQGQVVSFTRDATTGVLTLAGCTGTVPADAAPGSCTPGRALQSPQSLTVAPDGRGVYVAANYVESNEGSPDVLRSSALLTFTATPFG